MYMADNWVHGNTAPKMAARRRPRRTKKPKGKAYGKAFARRRLREAPSKEDSKYHYPGFSKEHFLKTEEAKNAWAKKQLVNASYVWLPIRFVNGVVTIKYVPEWDLDDPFAGGDMAPGVRPTAGGRRPS